LCLAKELVREEAKALAMDECLPSECPLSVEAKAPGFDLILFLLEEDYLPFS
jgi:hypothetical protein